MPVPENLPKLAEKMRAVHLLYGTFVAAVVILIGLPLSGAVVVPRKPLTPAIVYALIAVAAVNVTLSFLIQSRVIQKALTGGASDRVSAFNKCFVMVIVSAALRE